MKKMFSALIYCFGLLTLTVGLYASSFYLVRGGLIRPHERPVEPNSHPMRPIYNAFFYPMRWFSANGASFQSSPTKIYYGRLEKFRSAGERKGSTSSVELDSAEGGYLMIGFTGRQALVQSLSQIEPGTYLKIKFGRALDQKSDLFINRLVEFEVIDLMEDPRIPQKEFTAQELDHIDNLRNSLSADDRMCVNAFLEEYHDAVFEHCMQAGYAQNIGGGCAHLVGRGVNTAVIKQALEKCGHPASQTTD
jgi:hypothetical protein